MVDGAAGRGRWRARRRRRATSCLGGRHGLLTGEETLDRHAEEKGRPPDVLGREEVQRQPSEVHAGKEAVGQRAEGECCPPEFLSGRVGGGPAAGDPCLRGCCPPVVAGEEVKTASEDEVGRRAEGEGRTSLPVKRWKCPFWHRCHWPNSP